MNGHSGKGHGSADKKRDRSFSGCQAGFEEETEVQVDGHAA
jgi:hypothetical protein